MKMLQILHLNFHLIELLTSNSHLTCTCRIHKDCWTMNKTTKCVFLFILFHAANTLFKVLNHLFMSLVRDQLTNYKVRFSSSSILSFNSSMISLLSTLYSMKTPLICYLLSFDTLITFGILYSQLLLAFSFLHSQFFFFNNMICSEGSLTHQIMNLPTHFTLTLQYI